MKKTAWSIVFLMALAGSVIAFASPPFIADEPLFDVNDLTYLWPAPASKEDHWPR